MDPVKFCPPLHIQRYQFVIDFVEKHKPKKVADLGCAGCGLLRKLKFCRDIELLAGVDIDCAAITEKKYTLAPLSCEYLKPDNRPLTIQLYQGSVIEKEPRMKGFELVTCIELIEHLHPEEVEKFSEVLFGYMSPGAVIVSTPNADFNPLLPGLTGFRHQDHKFEWTQKEFQNWALAVCDLYGYKVEFTGVGITPRNTKNVGFCTQIGVFNRKSSRRNGLQRTETDEGSHSYKLLYDVVYPSLCDRNIFQNVLLNEVLYHAESIKKNFLDTLKEEESKLIHVTSNPLHSCSTKEQAVIDGGGDNDVCRKGNTIYIPLAKLFSSPKVQAVCSSFKRLKEVLLESSQIQLTSDASALMLVVEDEDRSDQEDWEECEDISYSETFISVAECEEDWEEELCQNLESICHPIPSPSSSNNNFH
nr:PREDICTED: small RNA 2'-O-methyltransferase isoform X1 [Lepisosteus oculatus]